jgi:hypothetical protein
MQNPKVSMVSMYTEIAVSENAIAAAKLVKNATLKIYPGAPHGLTSYLELFGLAEIDRLVLVDQSPLGTLRWVHPSFYSSKKGK